VSSVATLRLYAAPLPRELGSLALVAPPPLVEEVRHAGALLAYHPAPLELAVLAPGALDPARLQGPAGVVLRRAAVAATMAPPEDQPALPGPQGAWYAALVTWGWLSILGAGESARSTLGGLWLAAGLPLVRRAYRRALAAHQGRAALGLAGAIDAAQVRVVEHAGLQRLAAMLAAALTGSGQGMSTAEAAWRRGETSPATSSASTGTQGGEHGALASGAAEGSGAAAAHGEPSTFAAPGFAAPDAAGSTEVDSQLQRAALLCPAAGVGPLAAFYRSLAAHRPPAAVWTPVPGALTGPPAETPAPAALWGTARPT
jgi:hypothetical protein